MDGHERKLDGSRIAREIRGEVAESVRKLEAQGVTPRLDVVLVGEDPASKVYVGSKARTSAAWPGSFKSLRHRARPWAALKKGRFAGRSAGSGAERPRLGSAAVTSSKA